MANAICRNLQKSFRPARSSICAATRQGFPSRRAYATAGDVSATAAEGSQTRQDVLKQGARRNPELYILATIMTGAFGMAGYYFARTPTSANSEHKVAMADQSYPWESNTSGKYQYHPGGDKTAAPKDAPSALHSVIVPEVTLPAYLHETFNKYDKDEYDDY